MSVVLKKPSKHGVNQYLFDIGEWEHFINIVLTDWIKNAPSYDNDVIADTIEQLFINPLSSYIENQHQKIPNTNLVIAGVNLINYLNHDVGSKFRNRQSLFIEQLDTLQGLVNEFLAIYGSSAFIKTSITKSKIAKLPRIKNPPTKNDLLEFKQKWIADETHERGWIKAATREYDISRTKLLQIMKS